MRSMTWARCTWGPAAVTSLPSTFWFTSSSTRSRYSSRYFSGLKASDERPSISWSASASSPPLIFADSPFSISPKLRTSSAKYIVCSISPPCAGRMSTRLPLPRMTHPADERRAIHDLVADRAEVLQLDAGAALGVEQIEGDALRRGGRVELDRNRDQPEGDRPGPGGVCRHRLHDSTMLPMMREGLRPP